MNHEHKQRYLNPNMDNTMVVLNVEPMLTPNKEGKISNAKTTGVKKADEDFEQPHVRPFEASS